MLDQALEELIATGERPHVIAEELRLLLRRRDQLSLQASCLAGELAGIGHRLAEVAGQTRRQGAHRPHG